MSENPIIITNLNDFIFCPASIYFHAIEGDTERLMYQDHYQLNGTAAHEKTDSVEYSDKKSIFQSITVYSDTYGLFGKIDVFDASKGILTERKKKISTIYDGYVFQLYAQCFCLRDMGYIVNEIRLYSYNDNKIYKVDLPENNPEMNEKFVKLITDMNNFDFKEFNQENELKCKHCIYEPLCSYSAIEGESND